MQEPIERARSVHGAVDPVGGAGEQGWCSPSTPSTPFIAVGLKGTYQGLTATVLKQGSNQAIRFFVMTSLKNWYKGTVSLCSHSAALAVLPVPGLSSPCKPPGFPGLSQWSEVKARDRVS